MQICDTKLFKKAVIVFSAAAALFQFVLFGSYYLGRYGFSFAPFVHGQNDLWWIFYQDAQFSAFAGIAAAVGGYRGGRKGSMFALFKSRPRLPKSFERWSELDIIASSGLLYEGPSVFDIRSLKQWLDAYERWRGGYNEFIKAAATLEGSGFTDDFDRRQYALYTGLFFQSGQWHAILLMLLDDISESGALTILGVR